jgi:hypothetical protein
LKNRGLTLQSPSANRSQPELAARNGFLLTLNDCPLPSHHLGFEHSQPASSLLQLSFAPDPFGLPLLHPGSVCPSHGKFTATCPLPSSQPNCLLRPIDLRSPSGFLGPSGSKRSTDLPFEKLTLMLGPIPLRSPLALRFISLPADQRSRIATAHQVGCPLNLLEPFT